ncbi:outer membrane protein assembly factor BamA [Candidatus Pelagibacter sp. HIMB1593]|uniref:outer membrane protein assembly factor BamA n=1 Tax=Candidatus Pelagibacter sp. HIMB1593 TaxID=3413355 RepID=UPI003F852B21
MILFIKNFNVKLFILLIIFVFNFSILNANTINKINIDGNDRISKETIILFSNVQLNEIINDDKLDLILKNLYETNYFKNVSVKLVNNELFIYVDESPIIDRVEFVGIKAGRIIEDLNKLISQKSRVSYNEFLIINDRNIITNFLKNLGYYFSKVETIVEDLENNLVVVNHKIDLGDKAKIKKISFLGDKIYKDNKLRNIIVSEEYKFWKFISGRKYLNEQAINFDKRLLKNFYLNKGYYDVEINSSFARLVDEKDFELIFNIDAKKKIYFNNISLNIPTDFNIKNFENLNEFFDDLRGEPYSINKVESILDKLDKITLLEEYKSINASVKENFNNNQLDLVFDIEETEKLFVEKINIFGNNITRESVIRNNLEIDEGDPFNEILQNKSENNLKSLNFFKSVNSDIANGSKPNTKIINIKVEEKPTGEISAGAGVGTSGGTFLFGIKENNYLGKGLGVDANVTVNSESFKGKVGIENPNFNNTDKSLFGNLQAIEIDRMKANGYKTNKTGFEFGTRFEYYEDFNLGLSTRSFYEKIETDSTASARQQAQEGNYWDTFLNTRFDYDKRNQKFRADDGFRSTYTLDIPLISDNNTLTNTYNFQKYTSFYPNNVSSIGFFIESANSITGDDIKLTERLFIPTSKLRGFERGKVGPKDGSDFIGGNFVSSLNATTTLPVLFENNQNLDASIFLDVANIWGVDYDSTLDESNKIRSAIGIGIEWFSALGPVSFSITETISKADTDITESFRFNLGTTF